MVSQRTGKRRRRGRRGRHGQADPSLPDGLGSGSSSNRTIPSVARGDRDDETNEAPSQLINRPVLVSAHTSTPLTSPETEYPARPATRREFEIAIICALTLEADAIEALFDKHWDNNGPSYDKAPGDPNAYTTGAIGRHNVVLAHMPGMGKANAAAVAANCRASYPNVRLAVVVGICGAVPFSPDGSEIILGDVIVSDGVIQYDLGRRHPDRFVRKDTLLDSLGRPNTEIRALLSKLKGRNTRRELQNKIALYLEVAQRDPESEADYPGVVEDRLFEATYPHASEGRSCGEGCTGPLVRRKRLQQSTPQPSVHFGLVASGDTVMRSARDRDAIAQREDILSFDMEGAGVWDNFPCIVIKGACDYADSHKTKSWQPYAAATAAGCLKGFLEFWVPSASSIPESYPIPKQSTKLWFLVPYPKNDNFVGRTAVLKKLQQLPLKSASQTRASLFGLGGVGKTQIALEYAYWLREEHPDISVFWVRASNAEQFRQSFYSIAQDCAIPGHDDPKQDVLQLVKSWLERSDQGWWAMIIDNADDMQLFFPAQQNSTDSSIIGQDTFLAKYIPDCHRGSIFVTTRNKQAGIKLAKGTSILEICKMNDDESQQLLYSKLEGHIATPSNLLSLSSQLEHLPLALVQASAFIQANSITVDKYLEHVGQSDRGLINLLSEEFETVGRDSGVSHAVAVTWTLSFKQIERHNTLASELLSLMCLFDRQGIPIEFLSDFNEQRQDHLHHENIQSIQLTKALGILKAYSLITEKKDGDLDMHRLVQLVMQKWLATKGTMNQFAGQALLTVSSCYPRGEFETREKCTAYLPHVQAVLKLEGSRSIDENVARASILTCAGALFYFQGQGELAEKFQTQATKIYEETLGPDHPDTLFSMNDLASTYWGQGHWDKAKLLQVHVLKKRKIVLGPDHPGTLDSMGNLASIYWDQGHWDKAELLEVQVLEKRKIVLGPDHPDTLVSMGNLALTYWDQGHWDKAELLQVHILEKRKIVLGPDHPDTLVSMGNLALIYQDHGHWDKAKLLEVQVLEKRKIVLGPDHPDTLVSMGNLALIYQNQGHWDKAELLKVQVLEKRKIVLGLDHPDTLLSMHNLAHTWKSQGRVDDAMQLMGECVEGRCRILGQDHPKTVSSRSCLDDWGTEVATAGES